MGITQARLQTNSLFIYICREANGQHVNFHFWYELDSFTPASQLQTVYRYKLWYKSNIL